MSNIVITDCNDDNALMRVSGRLSSITGQATSHMRLPGTYDERAEIAAAGNLIDAIDTLDGGPGVILINVAPRRDDEYENGAPFCYFWVGNTIVVSTLTGYTLSLVREFDIVRSMGRLHTNEVAGELVTREFITKDLASNMSSTQFRSFMFAPYVAAALYENVPFPYEEIGLDDVADPPAAVWWIDNFGKSTVGVLPFYERLRDVPEGETALVIGSSGLGNTRFVEIVAKGGHAAEQHNFSIGDTILSRSA